MRRFNLLSTLVVFVFLLVLPEGSWAFATNSYDFMDDVPYLPKPRSAKKISALEEESIFDDVRLHAGAAFVNSFQDFLSSPGVRERGGIKGYDLSFGVDLFFVHWIAEGHIINLPESTIGDSRLSANGFELRLIYDTAIFEGITVHGGVGIGSRAYTIKSLQRYDTFIRRTERSFQSGATVLAAGIDYWPNAQVSAGVEVDNHLPMAYGDDPTSMDLCIKLNGHF